MKQEGLTNISPMFQSKLLFPFQVLHFWKSGKGTAILPHVECKRIRVSRIMTLHNPCKEECNVLLCCFTYNFCKCTYTWNTYCVDLQLCIMQVIKLLIWTTYEDEIWWWCSPLVKLSLSNNIPLSKVLTFILLQFNTWPSLVSLLWPSFISVE